MNDQLKPIETLLREQKYAEAEEALKACMTENPDDWDAKLLYGICRKLQGDEGTFRQIHEEAEKAADDEKKRIEASPLWKKYHRSYTGCLVAALIVGAGMVVGGGAIVAVKYAQAMIESVKVVESSSAYAGPEYYEKAAVQTKYGGPEYYEKYKEQHFQDN